MSNNNKPVVNSNNNIKSHPNKESPYIGFISGSLASICATTVTNPIELVKTRLQLQGELQMSQRIYTGIFDAFKKIIRTEGILGLQSGLLPAYFSQATMQGIRLGSFDMISDALGATPNADYFFLKNLASGAIAGAVGAALGSPFDLVKVRMQAAKMYANDPQFTNYTSSFSAFKQIIQKEGLKGLSRGMTTSAQRTAVGSAIQLSTYGSCKSLVLNFVDEGVYSYLLSSLAAGFLVTIGMNPFDVARTRLYYQGKGNSHGEIYKGLFDCVYKTIKQEGPSAVYKGFWAHYIRLGPHTVLTLVFWEYFKQVLTTK